MGGFDPNMEQSERAALVGKELDRAFETALENFSDVRGDQMWSDEEVRKEANVIRLLNELLDVWADVHPYIS